MANNKIKIDVDVNAQQAQQSTDKLTSSTSSLKQEYKELTDAIAKANLEGRNNTAEYQNMIKKAGELKDAMSDANKAINAAASDTSNLDAVLGAASAASGGFGAATAIMEIMGANTDDVSKAQKRLQQAIALVNSVQAISNALNKDSALMVKLNAVAHSLLSKQMNATAIATSAASGALKLFKAALISTGVGAAVVALGFLVEKFVSLSGSVSSVTSSVDTFNEKTKKKIQDLEREYEILEKKGDELAQAQLKLKHATEDADQAIEDLEALKNRKKEYEKTIELIKKYNEAVDTSRKSFNRNKIQQASAEKSYSSGEIRRLGIVAVPYSGKFSDKEMKELQESINEYNKKIEEGNAKIKETRNKAKQAQNELDDVEANEKKKKIQKQKEWYAKQIEQEKQFARNKRQIADETRESLRRQQELDIEGTDPNSPLYWNKRLTYAKNWYNSDMALEDERYKNQSANIKELGLTQEAVDNLHDAKVKELELKYAIMFKEINQGYEDYKKNLNDVENLEKRQQRIDIYQTELINQKNMLDTYKGTIESKKQLLIDKLKWEKQLELEAAEETGANRVLIEEKYQRMIDEVKWQAANEHVEIAKNMTDSISSIMNDAFEGNKGVQIATTIASTIANAAQTYGSVMATAPGGLAAKTAQALAASGAVIASGIKAVYDLNKTDKNTKSFSGGSTSSLSGSRDVSNQYITSRFNNINKDRVETVVVVDDIEYKMKQANRVKVTSKI